MVGLFSVGGSSRVVNGGFPCQKKLIGLKPM